MLARGTYYDMVQRQMAEHRGEDAALFRGETVPAQS
jgi:hypothetical protein